ncbi:MAG: PKD domain-containing protein [Candidatus Diapherotrites archaeon]|uniref:PKD domain-containing protein n=1 Tax=Candidatus Iainarchaeum sp. TaxID=3101447 RepID=A0A8T4KUB7_9ARCH|nr:PKD domain-containing protein [Candidatus Diapherotrites archaeon]
MQDKIQHRKTYNFRRVSAILLFIVIALSFASAQACPKTWTSQFDWASGIGENVDPSSVLGSLVLKKATEGIWKFDEGGGNIAHSSGDFDRNGTISGSYSWGSGTLNLSGNTKVDFGGFPIRPTANDNFSVSVKLNGLASGYIVGVGCGGPIWCEPGWSIQAVDNEGTKKFMFELYTTYAYPDAQGNIQCTSGWQRIFSNSISQAQGSVISAGWSRTGTIVCGSTTLDVGTMYLSATGNGSPLGGGAVANVTLGFQSRSFVAGQVESCYWSGNCYYSGLTGSIDEIRISTGKYNAPGKWHADYDAGVESTFNSLTWNSQVSQNTSVGFKFKSANTPTELESANWFTGNLLNIGQTGRYARIESTLSSDMSATPLLKDVTLNCTATGAGAGGGGGDGNCGNGTINSGETCDGSNLGGKTCSDFDSFTGGTLTCQNCSLNTSNCTAPPPYCGNGTIDSGESCDGGNLGGRACTDFDSFTGGSLGCASCSFDTSQCTGGTPGGCGNGTINTGETCDGSNLGGKTCSDIDDFVFGSLSCNPNCSLNTSGCIKAENCGNGTINSGETCDGSNLGGKTCPDFGFAGGTLSCSASCAIDTGNCTRCGNNAIDAGEECDGSNLGGKQCTDFDDYASGILGCSSCSFNTSNCTTCGNNRINPGEQCDGTDFGGKTCTDYGFTGGTLGCASGCSIDTSNCTTNLSPVAIISPTNAEGFAGNAISFDGSASYDPDGTITSYAWNFGNGQAGGGTAAQGTYSSAGVYTVSLTVTDNLSATDGASATATVIAPSTGTCPSGKTWTTKEEWDSGSRNQVDTANYPGSVRITDSQTSGTLNLYFDSGQQSSHNALSFNAEKPAGTEVKVRLRAANTLAGLASAAWTQYYTAGTASLSNQIGRYAELEALLETSDASITPKLNDLTLGCSGLPSSSIDLIVESVALSPGSSVAQGTAVNITATIKNNSSIAINSPFAVALYQGLATGTPLQTQNIASLGANASSTIQFTNISTSSLSGSVIFTVFADSANAIPEADETNNQQQAGLAVTSATGVDIAVISASFNPAAVSRSQGSQLSVTVENNGANATGSFYVSLSKSGAPVQIITVPDLAPGASTTLEFSVSSADSGAITFTALADSTNILNESDETNNSASAVLTVSTNKPDLSLVSFIADSLQPIPGAIVKLTATIKNLGIAVVQQAFSILLTSAGLALETKDLSAAKSCTNELGQQVSAALCSAANSGDTEAIEFSIDTSGKSGNVEYTVYADSGNAVDEDNENNNTGTLTLNITDKPDLHIRAVSYPRSIIRGQSAAMAADVGNMGSKAAGTSNLYVYRRKLSVETTITNAGVPTLAAATIHNSQFSLSTAGLEDLVEVFSLADSANSVDESNENNNSAGITMVILSGEICNNAVDDDADGRTDADDPECVEICADGLDNDADGKIDEGCGEICWDAIDNDADGLIDESCDDPPKEKCGDSIDNDQDGLVDEGCPFIFTECIDTDEDAICNEDEIMKFHTDPEDADSDNDCVNDGQEIKYDLTDPVDINSNVISIDITKEVSIGEKVEIRAKHPMLGTIKSTRAEITWQHKKVVEDSDAEGLITYEPLEEGTYKVNVQVCANRIKGSFSVIAAGLTMQHFLTNIAKLLFGQAIVEAPLLLILLVVLCGIAAVLAYKHSHYLFEEGAKSSEEIRRETLARAALSVIAFALPLIANRFLSLNAAIVLAIAEIFVIIVFAYFKGQQAD